MFKLPFTVKTFCRKSLRQTVWLHVNYVCVGGGFPSGLDLKLSKPRGVSLTQGLVLFLFSSSSSLSLTLSAGLLSDR